MNYGISVKNKHDFYILKFDNLKDAEKWLNTEEYNFRTRFIYDSLEKLITDNNIDICDITEAETITENYCDFLIRHNFID